MSELSHALVDIRDAIRHLEQRMDARFEAVDRRFEEVDHRLAHQFTWVVGIQVTTLIAVVGALAGALFTR